MPRVGPDKGAPARPTKGRPGGRASKKPAVDGGTFEPLDAVPARETDAAGSGDAESYPVVAVGASAGGLEAFSALIAHVPEDTGMAFVLVQHQDGGHPSHLAELLQRQTRLPVRLVEEGLRIEPNVVHVAPAENDISIENDVFRTTPKIRAGRGRHPIDSFFDTVAERYGPRAIGVILSGSMSDGVLGLGAIKAAGGVTFAQDSESAAFPEMPREAERSGAADMVLPPERIAKELSRISKHPYLRAPEPTASGDGDGDGAGAGFEDPAVVRRLMHALRSGTSVDFSNYRATRFRRRVLRRMAVRRIPSLGKYVDHVRANPSELKALFDDILITVTRFFRDPEVFQSLRSNVFPAILSARPPDAPIRIWVPGCSTGEEVYSIAMTLIEAFSDARKERPASIFATDISETALDRARKGEYVESVVDVLDGGRKERFFTRSPNGYQINKRVRDLCIFARQNVASDPPLSNLDLLSCRNLLIYLDPELQDRVYPTFHYALRTGGFLLLGGSESVGRHAPLFQSFDRPNRIFVKVEGSIPLPRAGDRNPRRAVSSQRTVRTRLNKHDVARLADRVILGRFGPPGIVVNDAFEIVQFRGRTSAFLETASGAATLNALQMAREGLLAPLRAALLDAKKTGKLVRKAGVRVRQDGTARVIDLEVAPIHEPGMDGSFFLVVFDEEGARATRGGEAPARVEALPQEASAGSLRSLEQELASTKEYLQSIIEEQEAANEELKSANEEILSANEELQSSNEELETTKEELQSANEELHTVNEELRNLNLELNEVQNDLANIFGIQIPILMIGHNGIVRRLNEPAERLFHFSQRDVGQPLSAAPLQLRSVDLSDLVEQVVQSMRTLDREVQDASGNWYSLRIKPYRAHDGRIEGTIVALFDLRGAEQVSRSRDYASAVLDTAREPLLVLDEALRIRVANKPFLALFQTSPERVERRTLDDLWNLSERAPGLAYALRSVLDDGDPVINREISFDVEPAGPRTMLINARRMLPAGEARPYVLLALDDITERKWAEAGLRASELRYRLLFETAREGIWLLDGETGEILDVNPFLMEILDRPKEELVGSEPWELYTDPEAAKARFDELRRQGFSYDPELSVRTRSGDELRIEAVSNVYSVGRSRVVQCNMRDVTDRVRLQAQVRQMQKLDSIGTLAGGIAHDFNNILNIISAHQSLFQRDGGSSSARQRESSQAIQKAVTRGAAVVRQLLTFARRSDSSFQPVEINALIEEVLGMVEETFPKSIRLERDLGPDLPQILADPNQLHQALLNLLVNARDAMPRGGKITVRSRTITGEKLASRLEHPAAASYVAVEIKDEGVGMDEETRKRLFEPFFTTKEKGKGQGMGLAVVYGVVQAHQGAVDAESKPGEGACFALYFPVSRESRRPSGEADVDPRAAEGDGHEGAGRTVLFVEDEELLQGAIQSLLEAEGYRVILAGDGLQAVEIHEAKKSEIAVVIIDLGLPKLDGWEAFLRMKKSDPDLKAIIASGNLDHERRAEMQREGIRKSLRKPYGAREIIEALRETLASDPAPAAR